jgi:hypothetical protein
MQYRAVTFFDLLKIPPIIFPPLEDSPLCWGQFCKQSAFEEGATQYGCDRVDITGMVRLLK